MILGAHLSGTPALHSVFDEARAIGAQAVQIMTAAPQRWSMRTLKEDVVSEFRGRAGESSQVPVFAHASFLINAASPKEDLRVKSKTALVAEMERAEQLGLRGVVLHPGSATDGERSAGVVRAAETIAEALLEFPGACPLLIENTSGKGNTLGRDVKEMLMLRYSILAAGVEPEAVGFCLDTCHLYASGVDLTDPAQSAFRAWLRALGPESIHLLHLNDSVGDLGSTTDRHAHIGRGHIGEDGFRHVLALQDLASIPAVLETPVDRDGDMASNLATLRRLRVA